MLVFVRAWTNKLYTYGGQGVNRGDGKCTGGRKRESDGNQEKRQELIRKAREPRQSFTSMSQFSR